MTKYREILRLLSLELSQRDIATSLGVSRNTVTKVRNRAKELSLTWPLDESLTDAIMDRIFFDSYKIPITSLDPEKDISMREAYGLDPSQAQ